MTVIFSGSFKTLAEVIHAVLSGRQIIYISLPFTFIIFHTSSKTKSTSIISAQSFFCKGFFPKFRDIFVVIVHMCFQMLNILNYDVPLRYSSSNVYIQPPRSLCLRYRSPQLCRVIIPGNLLNVRAIPIQS